MNVKKIVRCSHIFLWFFVFTYTSEAIPASFDLGQGSYWNLGGGWEYQHNGGTVIQTSNQNVGNTFGSDFSINSGLNDISFDLINGESGRFKFGEIQLDEYWICESELDNLELTAFIDFDLPEGLNFVGVGGTARPIVGLVNDFADNEGTIEDLTITFLPVIERLVDGTEFTILLSDENLDPLSFAYMGQVKEVWGSIILNNEPLSQSSAPVPEPATILLIGSGLIGIVGYQRRKLRESK